MATTIDVSALRRQLLTGFRAYAEALFKKHDKLESVLLLASQYFADEAGDAVHDHVRLSKSPLPVTQATETDFKRDYELQWKTLKWDSNGAAVYAFSAHCSEEGGSPYTAPDVPEFDPEDESTWVEPSQSESPLALAQRDGKKVALTWLGFPHRAWLDFPRALEERDEGWDEELEFVDDPKPVTPPATEQALLQRVYDAPFDVGPREVLRDTWEEQGDVRGEFAALTLSGKPKRERVAALVAEHGRKWLGPLMKVVPLSGAYFDRGPFLDRAVAWFEKKGDFDAVKNEPSWATVRVLTLLGEGAALSPMMRGLEEVGPLKASDLAVLKKGEWRISRLELDVPAKALDDVAKLELPLRRLSLRVPGPVTLKPLAKAKWFAKLEELEVWLSSSTAQVAKGLQGAIDALEEVAPEGMTLRAGVLSPAGRTGWVLERAGKKRVLRLLSPDERISQGPALAKELDVKLDSSWVSDGDWLAHGLGL